MSISPGPRHWRIFSELCQKAGAKGNLIPDAFLAALAIGSLAFGISADNGGLIGAGVLLAVIAAWYFVAAWPLRIDQTEALAVASRTVGFPVGHASAQLGWRGLRSRPSWRILLYSADSPPSLRGLVELDAVDATVIGDYVEENPEDWSQLGLEDEGADQAG